MRGSEMSDDPTGARRPGSGPATRDVAIETLFLEQRQFPPSPEFAAQANVNDPAIYELAAADPQAYWAGEAAKLDWYRPWDTVLEWDPPFAKWFNGGQLNVSVNCLDRHVNAGGGDKVAYYWEGEPGDRIAIYMPMVPELPVAMLACARIGAPHTVVFGGFSAEALADRINDSQAKLVVTADGGYRRGKASGLKINVDEAVNRTPSIEHVLVVQRTGQDVIMADGRDVWWHDVVPRQPEWCEPERMESEDMLYLLYTSGTTAKPKGILHTTGGYLTGITSTHRNVFDIKANDVFWAAADIGWVTGHSYIVYGPLANHSTGVMYEGTPDWPNPARWWEIGEPINPEAWMWYQEHIGGGQCPIVDTWWQTETGGIMISPLPGLTTTKPGSATIPFPGIEAKIYSESGEEIDGPGKGNLVVTRPWPGMLRTIYKDPERYRKTYWERLGDKYFVEDGAERDEDGYYTITGRIDDVMNVSGHRIGTMEVESALVSHEAVVESAVIGRHDEDKGQAIVAYVILEGDREGSEELIKELNDQVRKAIGPHARPEEIIFTPDLPKTRSGKIMRRVLRGVAEGEDDLGDVSTLADPSVVDDLKEARSQS